MSGALVPAFGGDARVAVSGSEGLRPMIVLMDDVRVGRALRALRLRRRLRQADVAIAAGVAQSTISLIERGHWSTLSIRTVRRVFGIVDARFKGLPTWRGGALDRLLDERHAQLIGAFAGRLRQAGWEVVIEATFSEYGERGAMDILAGRRDHGAALVVEAKTDLVSVEETLRRLDVKTRLASRVAAERLGWQPRVVGRCLVIADGSTARRRVARHGSVLERALPARGHAVGAWLGRPVGPMAGLLFLPSMNPSSTRRRLVSPGDRASGDSGA
jgi:transcriptional regulator with XRE-family HTH domain